MLTVDRIIQRNIGFIERYNLIEDGDSILIAVSGGPDSVYLLDLLSQYSKTKEIFLRVAYVHHHLRKEACKELQFVKKRAAGYGFPFYYRNVSITGNKSIEDEARRKRYGALAEIAKKYKCGKIATGHTFDDQAETIIMRILRGSGLKGLCGISPASQALPRSNITIIHPLLLTRKHEIIETLNGKKIPFSIDSSNSSLKFFRNRIRHETLPVLEKINPKIKEQLVRTSFLLQDDFSFIDSLAQQEYERICKKDAEGIHFKKDKFCCLPVSLKRMIIGKTLNVLFSPYFSFIIIEEVRQKIEQGCKLFSIPKFKGYVYENAGTVTISRTKPVIQKSFCLEISLLRTYRMPSIGIAIYSRRVPFSKSIFCNTDKFTAYFDSGKIKDSLFLRSPKKNDVFQPLGMQKEKKLSRFFIDKNVPRHVRKTVPILICNNQIAWVAGIQISEKFKVERNCRKVLQFKITKIFHPHLNPLPSRERT